MDTAEVNIEHPPRHAAADWSIATCMCDICHVGVQIFAEVTSIQGDYP